MDNVVSRCLRRLGFFVLVILFCSVVCQAAVTDPSFVLNFDKSLEKEIPPNLLVERLGGKIVPQGISGNALQLNPGEYLVLNLNEKINNQEGALMLWVRPHWPSTSSLSHTFLSFTWSGDDKSYFALSRGWWEPKGAKLTYFILSNQDWAHLSKLVDYEENGWTHLTCTWKAGSPGYVRFYVNGFKSPWEIKYTPKMARHGSSKLYVGSDQGSKVANGRWADSDLDELAFFQKTLTDEEIFAIFQEQNRSIRRSPKKMGGKIIETRAIFDEGAGWATETGARKTIARIKRAGFNVYVPCIWHGKGARYPNSKGPLEPGLSFSAEDPLKRLIKIAHENNIEVHPWFCVALRSREYLMDFYGPGTPKNAFDLHRPAFRSFISDVIADVVKRYDVDGVNLDYIRTMGICTCDFCRGEYHKTTGSNLLTDIAHPNRDGTLQPDLQKWQDAAVEDIVRQVKEKGKALKPRLIISVCGHPLPSPNQQGREEVKWANADLVDLIFNMDYSLIPDFENHNVIRNRLKDPGRLSMILANYQWSKATGLVPVAPEHLVRLVETLQSRWPGQVGFYIYSLLRDAQIEALARGPFQFPAEPAWGAKASR